MRETNGYKQIKQITLQFVESLKVGDAPGIYKKEKDGEVSFYGSYHAAHIYDLFGELTSFSQEDLISWAEQFQINQTKQGYFSKSRADFLNRSRDIMEMEPLWHFTRGNIWSLRVLGFKSKNEFEFIEPLMNKRTLYNWVKHYDWANSWAAGNQILAATTVLLAQKDWFGSNIVDEVLEFGMYPALEELQDEATGFWGTQYGANMRNGLFGTIHIAPIYFKLGWELTKTAPMIDSTLSCQLEDGSFWEGGSDCPDYDGAYMMTNLGVLSQYRNEDLKEACKRYLNHALMHLDKNGGWLLHRKDSKPSDWNPRPHWIWKENSANAIGELRDDDPNRTHIMLGSWFYPLSIALISRFLTDTGFEGPYHFNSDSLHLCNSDKL